MLEPKPQTDHPTPKGRFITLEGIDGAGKSSHVEWICDWLRSEGKTVICTREPGGTQLGEALRKLLLSQSMHLETETLLMFAARREHLAQVIEPALARGEWIICDRFSDATYAYQGGGRKLSKEKMLTLEKWTHDHIHPDLTLLFDLPIHVARERIISSARDLDRFEQENALFYEHVQNAYIERARTHPKRIKTINADCSKEAIQQSIRDYIQAVLLQP